MLTEESIPRAQIATGATAPAALFSAVYTIERFAGNQSMVTHAADHGKTLCGREHPNGAAMVRSDWAFVTPIRGLGDAQSVTCRICEKALHKRGLLGTERVEDAIRALAAIYEAWGRDEPYFGAQPEDDAETKAQIDAAWVEIRARLAYLAS
jgi:hypothetical protein